MTKKQQKIYNFIQSKGGKTTVRELIDNCIVTDRLNFIAVTTCCNFMLKKGILKRENDIYLLNYKQLELF